MATALFGAGCFWGVEDTFRQVEGVTATAVGFAGGHTENASYKEVCSGKTGHAEVVQVAFDPEKVSYEQLLETFWNCHNPTTLNRQGPDIGTQYRSIILYFDDAQKAAATASKDQLMLSGKYNGPIVTEIIEADQFHMAEDDHQQYFEKKGISHCRVA